MGDNVVRTVTSNMFWRFSERILAQLIGFIVSIILARILDPSNYGTVALMMVFINVLQVFVDSGLGNALIQKKNVDDIDYSTVFFTNVVFCILLYGLLFLSSDLIAGFYKDPELTSYIKVLGLIIPISGIKNVQQAYVSRNMLFKKFFFATTSGTVIAGFSGVILALKGAGVWALVAQQLINLSIDTCVLWITVKWRPVKSFSFERLKGLFGFGWKLLASSLLDTGFNEIRKLCIGKIYTSSDLAFYDQGDKLPGVMITNLNTTIDSVLLPVMSKEQDDSTRVRAMLRRSIKVGIYIVSPFVVWLSVVAEPLVRLMLTEKWLHTVFFIRVFCFSYLFFPIHTANLNAMKALGRSDLFLKLEIVKKALMLVLLFLTVSISAEAIAVSMLVTSCVSVFINAFPNRKLLGYGTVAQILDILPEILCALFTGVCIYLMSFIGLSDWLMLVLSVVFGLAVYFLLSKLMKLDSLDYLVMILKGYVRKKRK